MSGIGMGDRLLLLAGAIVLATVGVAWWLMGSPSTQRALRLDERRVQELQAIESLIDGHVREHKALPAQIATIAKAPGLNMPIVDPVTGAPYGYRVLDARRYQLCGVFDTDTAQGRDGRQGYVAREWAHPRGAHCFVRTLDDAVKLEAQAAAPAR